MNILFIEDECELRELGVAQLELHNYTVYPVSNLEAARAIMVNPSMPVHLVVADHRLPDGQGVDFVIEMKEQFPDCMYTIVSGCLTDDNISVLEENGIPYHRKPLLYGKVVEAFRREHLAKVPVKEPTPEAPIEPEAKAEAEAEAKNEAEGADENSGESEAPKRKKWFGLFNKS